jgi:hypothetical protein
MGRGVPKNGFRMTAKRRAQMAAGLVKDFAVAKNVVPVIPAKKETEAEIDSKLKDRFATLDTMTLATVLGRNKSMIVSGPAGVGKSHGIGEILDANSGKVHATVISGFVRATGLYKTLYEFRHPNSVVVFDDADSIFSDEASLNLLKKACDTTKKRTLSWLAETNMEDENGDRIERQFEFKGSIIFITNYDFDEFIARGSKLAPHFEALVSRSHYLDLGMKTVDDYVVRIKQVIREHGMLRANGFNTIEEQTLIAFVVDNKNKLRELSLRMVLKLANLMRIDPKNWMTLAKTTCFKTGV